MSHHQFWIAFVLIEVILYLLLALHLHKTNVAIRHVDALGIQTNFRWVKHISYLLLAMTYFSFIAKFFTHNKEHKAHHHHFCGITYVSIALITILVVQVQRFQDTMRTAAMMPVPIEVIDDRFQMVDKIGKMTALFVILSKSIAMGVKHGGIEAIVHSMSPRTL